MHVNQYSMWYVITRVCPEKSHVLESGVFEMVKVTRNRGNGRVYGLGFRDEVIMIAARQSGTSTRDACKF